MEVYFWISAKGDSLSKVWLSVLFEFISNQKIPQLVPRSDAHQDGIYRTFSVCACDNAEFASSPLASPLATPSGKMRKDLKRSGSSRKIVAKERSPSSKEKSGSHLDVESPMDKDVRRDVRDIMKKIHDAQGRTAKEGICWKSVGDEFRSKSIRRPAMQ